MEQRKQPLSAFFKKKQTKIITPVTDKTLQQSKLLFQSSDIFNSLLCPQHSEQIHHLCFTCDAKLLCARCFNKGQHADHEVKSLEKAYLPIMNNLNQFLIRLRSKADLLSILHEKISHNQIEQYQHSETIKQAIICQYQQICQNLQSQKELLLTKITEIIQQKTKQMDSIMTRIRQSVQDSMSLYKRIEKNINEMHGNLLCTFYSQAKKQLDKYANEDTIRKFKDEVPCTKLQVDLEMLQSLSNQIKEMEIFSDLSLKKNLYHPNNKLSKKKLRKLSKFPIKNIKESLPQSPRTPKSKQRITAKTKGFKNSTEQIKYMLSNKNYSMPASPDKKQHSVDKQIQKKRNLKKKTLNN